ncbi:helicase [Altererythrobacter sp. HHU K3-1]|uniref:Helicase n=2 Tax=Qipengyuania atrilutea TaxID=2744473 RepID=A0A850GXW1_9SPHN|nr:helicase [Actirhodobacter atriluteus]
MCAHSSGAIGFPLRLLAREVYDRVVAIKGEKQVALITGEQRIEPPDARYFLCTAEAMPLRRPGMGGGPEGDFAFVALDEAQLAADRERGHIFTDRLLHARGREETMLLGSATLEPLVRQLEPKAELVERPRFSTLTHIGARKLSRLPPRSAVVAFSAEQVYGVAEMLRRFRGGAAVVMGALSPETRNRQVDLFQSGEVDYIVATDAIGMGLNLDLNHVAFAGLTKFDGMRQRRLQPAEMAQIAGRAGRHQRDGTFGVLAGMSRDGGRGAPPPEFDDEEVYAIEEHRFAPLTRLYWREPEPRFDSIEVLIADLEAPPDHAALAAAPEAIDLAVLKRLHSDGITEAVKGAGSVRRFWEICQLPDFRSQGTDMHARFVSRLWADLSTGYLGADYVASRIAQLDNVQGDIDTLQGRIAAIRSWAYICQRPDWVLARDEMAARARAAEAKLSDALHARLTERFVNRRTTLLMKTAGQDASLLPITIGEDDAVLVEDERIGHLEGFRFVVDTSAGHEDRKMLLAAAEKALPGILAARATKLTDSGMDGVTIMDGALHWQGHAIASLDLREGKVMPALSPARDLAMLPAASREAFMAALEGWLTTRLEPLAPLEKLHEAARDPAAESEARAIVHTLIAGHGFARRDKSGLMHLPKELRPFLRRLGVTFGALDIFVPALLKPAPRQLLHMLGIDRRPLQSAMLPVIAEERNLPSGYRPAGEQAIRLDLAEKVFRAAHEARSKSKARKFFFDSALPVSIGLEPANYRRLMSAAGFRLQKAPALAEGAFGPPVPDKWEWQPSSRRAASGKSLSRGKPERGKRERSPQPKTVAEGNPFGALADLMR